MAEAKTYNVVFYGKIGVRPFGFEEKFVSDKWARDWAATSLPHYYPTYDRIVVWREGDVQVEEAVTIVCDLKATLQVTSCA